MLSEKKNLFAVTLIMVIIVYFLYLNNGGSSHQCWVEEKEFFTEGGLMTDWTPSAEGKCSSGGIDKLVQTRKCVFSDPASKKKCAKFLPIRQVKLNPCKVKGRYIRVRNSTDVLYRTDKFDQYKVSIATMRIIGGVKDHPIVAVKTTCDDPEFPTKNLIGAGAKNSDYTTTCIPNNILRSGSSQWIEADIGSDKEISKVMLTSGNKLPHALTPRYILTVYDSNRKVVFEGVVLPTLLNGETSATVTVVPMVAK